MSDPDRPDCLSSASQRPLTLMVQGTTSDAGKSTLVAALCRILRRRGVAVAPFKPQNMALNSAVTIDGGEIGRAQALQAQAAGLAPHTDFNPILLKPNSDRTSQLIIGGQARANLDARAYQAFKPQAMRAVLDAYGRLARRYGALIVEGAGSPAEINLRANDIANMGFAQAVDCPVLLVADIDRGGVFAHLVGTLELLAPEERARVIGLVINRFRGDASLLDSGIAWLEARTGKPVLAVLPFLPELSLDAEDALPANAARPDGLAFNVVCPALPRISNATDLDPLRLHPGMQVRIPRAPPHGEGVDLIVLPGTKSVRADLAWLRAQGWDDYLLRHLRYGGKVIGICGGMQMLGTAVHDPLGIEGEPGSSVGLGLLDYETTLESVKQLRRVRGCLTLDGAPPLAGYEIHAGRTTGPGLKRHAAMLADGRADGARSRDEQILASYLHGLFDQPGALKALLKWCGYAGAAHHVDRDARREADLDRLADAVAARLDVEALLERVKVFNGVRVSTARKPGADVVDTPPGRA